LSAAPRSGVPETGSERVATPDAGAGIDDAELAQARTLMVEGELQRGRTGLLGTDVQQVGAVG
jgi:hypothetical protein